MSSSAHARVMRRVAAVALSLTVSAAPVLRSEDMADRRAEVGARVFRALLAADVDLPKKTIAGNQILIVFFFYGSDSRRAVELAGAFVGAGDVRGLPVVTEVSNDATFARYAGRLPAGVFLADAAPRATVQSLARFGIDRHVIVYSPFEGDVESGILGGLSIEAQVRPYLNRATLESSHITLKEFFLKVAKVYQ